MSLSCCQGDCPSSGDVLYALNGQIKNQYMYVHNNDCLMGANGMLWQHDAMSGEICDEIVMPVHI